MQRHALLAILCEAPPSRHVCASHRTASQRTEATSSVEWIAVMQGQADACLPVGDFDAGNFVVAGDHSILV